MNAKSILGGVLCLVFAVACGPATPSPDGGSGGGGSATGGGGGGAVGGGGGVTGGGGGALGGGGGGGVSTPSVNLGTSGNFAVLAKTAISTVPASAITGDVGVSPAAASFITGFSLVADATNVFSTSPQVTGQLFAANYTPPTPSNLTTAVADMELAFTDAAGRPASVTELGAGDISGRTLSPGVYGWGTGLLITSDVTLDGSATDVWILQIAQNLTIGNAVRVSLTGGALPKNVFWQVAGQISLGTTAHAEGVMLSQTSITLGTGASVNGRLLAQTAIALDAATVVQPAP